MEQQPVRRKKHIAGNTMIGLLFLLVGGVLFMRQSGYPFPPWLFSWQMILITLGVFVGIRNRFQDLSWFFMILVGLVFLSDNIWPGFNIKQYTVPVIIMILGLIFILSPKNRGICHNDHHMRRRMRQRMRQRYQRMHQDFREGNFPEPHDRHFETNADFVESNDTVLDLVSVFSGIKKKVLSKQFMGGEITCVFGGSEVNLSSADFASPIVLELVQIFGATKLIVPPNWEIRSEVSAIFGGVDDKRPESLNLVPERTIVLKGTVIFGGVEVNSY